MQVLPVGLISYLLLTRSNQKHLGVDHFIFEGGGVDGRLFLRNIFFLAGQCFFSL